MIKPDIHKALLKATQRSTHKRHMTGCVIVNKKGEILADGCSHASSFRMNELHSIHAEIHALGRGRFNDLKGSTAYIYTMARKSGNFVLSAPCLTCAIALRSAGVKKAVYTTGGGMDPWATLSLDSMIEEAGLKVYPKRKEIKSNA